ncbi:hypothetical protein ACFYQQ_26280 [Streptomyces sp. NPDC005496]|uniref:hypothetical protein n=2 Tax=unclassified Streptomyces TaxID=2593676 RepID=UPI00369F63AF
MMSVSDNVPGGIMHFRTTIAAATAVLAVTLAGCSSGDDGGEAKSAPSRAGTSEPSAAKTPGAEQSGGATPGDAKKATGIPAEPDAATRAQLIRALSAIDPALVADEDKAVTNARNQCSTLDGGRRAETAARTRFSTSDHKVTHVEARKINVAVSTVLCN